MTQMEIYVAIQTLLAGERTEDCIGALADSLGQVVGFAVREREKVEPFLLSLVPDITKNTLDEWAIIERALATPLQYRRPEA